MKRKHLFPVYVAAILLMGSMKAGAQGMAVNTTGSAANASSILDVSSTTQGMLIPRMTAAQRTAIGSPATGLLVYQTDGTPGFYFYQGGWSILGGGSPTGAAGGDLSGTYPNPTISSSAGTGNNIVTAINAGSGGINVTKLASGGTLPAENGSNLTALNGSAISSGTVPVSHVGTGSGSATTFLNGTGAFSTPASGGNLILSSFQSPGTSSSISAYSQAVGAFSGGSGVSGGTASQNFDMVAGTVTLDAMYVSPIISATYISGPANVYTGTVYKNGAATSMSVTVTTGTTNAIGTVLTTVSDLSHTVSLVAGDKISVLWSQTQSVNGELANMRVSFHGQ